MAEPFQETFAMQWTAVSAPVSRSPCFAPYLASNQRRLRRTPSLSTSTFLSRNQYSTPIGLRRATPPLLFQHRPGHPPNGSIGWRAGVAPRWLGSARAATSRQSNRAGSRLRRPLAATVEDGGSRDRAQDHRSLREERLERRVEAEGGEPRSVPDLVIGKDLSFLELLQSFADEHDGHHEQKSRRYHKDCAQRQADGQDPDRHEQDRQHQSGDEEAGDKRRAPSARGLRERMDEQHCLGALAEHREERERTDRRDGALLERAVGLL